MPTAVIYYRVSDPRQIDGTSLESQEEQCRNLVEQHGWYLDSSWPEEGHTAKTDKRRVLPKMLDYLRRNRRRIDYCVFPKIDRMARMVRDYHRIKDQLAEYGIQFVSVGERFDDTPAGRFSENVMAATAQFDNEIRAERCKGGMEKAVRDQGRWVWRAPFGYANGEVNGKPNIVPSDKADLVRWLFNEVASRRLTPDQAFHEAADRGYDRGRSQFYSLLRNPVYTGIIRSFDGEWSGSFEPLISETDFRRVQSVFRSEARKRSYHYFHPDFPLKSTLRCHCGAALSAGWAKRVYGYYRCYICGHLNMRRDDAHNGFVDYLRQEQLPMVYKDALTRHLAQALKHEQQHLTGLKKNLGTELTRITDLRKGIALKSAAGVIPDELAREQLAELEDKAHEIQEKIAGLPPSGNIDEQALRYAISFVSHLDEEWLRREPAQQVKLQSFFFPEGVMITKKRSFATHHSRLQELRKWAQDASHFTLVDQAFDGCNSFLTLIQDINDRFGPAVKSEV